MKYYRYSYRFRNPGFDKFEYRTGNVQATGINGAVVSVSHKIERDADIENGAEWEILRVTRLTTSEEANA